MGVDDEIRARIKEVKALLMEEELDKEIISSKIDEMIYEINEMIYKEESILFPMTLDHLTQDEWITIAEESEEIGYCLTGPAEKWKPERVALEEDSLADGQRDTGNVKFETGFLSPKEINGIFSHLPVDITFVDKDNIVKYFSQTKERIFARTKAVIGRNVGNCHPPASVHVVESIVEDFKSGRRIVRSLH